MNSKVLETLTFAVPNISGEVGSVQVQICIFLLGVLYFLAEEGTKIKESKK